MTFPIVVSHNKMLEVLLRLLYWGGVGEESDLRMTSYEIRVHMYEYVNIVQYVCTMELEVLYVTGVSAVCEIRDQLY
jgi:hypothetical protein